MTADGTGGGAQAARYIPALIFSWIVVGLPLLWGVAQTIKRALALFH